MGTRQEPVGGFLDYECAHGFYTTTQTRPMMGLGWAGYGYPWVLARSTFYTFWLEVQLSFKYHV